MWASPNALQVQRAADTVTMASVTTAAGAVSTNSTAVRLARPLNGIIFEFDLTAAATDVGDTLDAKIQTTIDGTNWLDVAYFTQMLGNGGAKRFIMKICTATAQALYETGTALSAGSVRNIFGDQYRVNYVQVDANSNASFTFVVYAKVV